jgi:excinuclease ABC subunit C
MSWASEEVARITAAIPHQPGVYVMRDAGGRVLYIGKAIDLANRVAQYFHASGDPRPFVKMLHGLLERVDTIVTTNEKEALLLENELIKKHRPPFNIVLRDDKTYLYLRIDPGDRAPRAELVRRRRADGALYFGPYHNAASIRGTHSLVNRHFGLCTCKESEFRNRTRPCLEFQMGRCLGPCVGLGSAEAYRERVEAAVLFLRGRHEEVRKALAERMRRASEAENFEEAARLRDQLKAVESAMTRQAVVLPTQRDADAIGLGREGDVAAFAVLRFEGGVLSERVPYVLDGAVAPSDDLLESFVVQYYGRAPIPADVYLPSGILDDTRALDEVLRGRVRDLGPQTSDLRPPPLVRVHAPARGPAADAVRMACQNAVLLARESLASGEARSRASMRVTELLGLSSPPRRIEGYDLSTLFSAEPVGVAVTFLDGKPDKRGYRTFAVRLEEGPGDVGFLREVLRRRFSKATEPGESPDLVLIDGGESQLRTAADVLSGLGLDVPLVALAKSRVVGKGSVGPASHSPERLYVLDAPAGVREPGAPAPTRLIVPPQNDAGLHLLMRVRDEAHRFAVKFHRRRRAKREAASALDGIPGLGKTRRVALLRHFGSVAAIRAASVEDLATVNGIPATVAEAVHERMHGG